MNFGHRGVATGPVANQPTPTGPVTGVTRPGSARKEGVNAGEGVRKGPVNTSGTRVHGS